MKYVIIDEIVKSEQPHDDYISRSVDLMKLWDYEVTLYKIGFVHPKHKIILSCGKAIEKWRSEWT